MTEVQCICVRCGKQFPKRRTRNLYCASCGKIRQRENGLNYDRRRHPLKDGIPVGISKPCAQCGANFIKYKGRYWFCRACSKKRKCDRERRYYVKRTPAAILHKRISIQVRKSLMRRKTAPKGGRRWETLVGYSCVDLAMHLERQFKGRMSWANMGKWEIDHIIPLVSFQFDSDRHPDFKAAWALTNLRPLWRRSNRVKHSKRLHLL
jgi:hypothetical protein